MDFNRRSNFLCWRKCIIFILFNQMFCLGWYSAKSGANIVIKYNWKGKKVFWKKIHFWRKYSRIIHVQRWIFCLLSFHICRITHEFLVHRAQYNRNGNDLYRLWEILPITAPFKLLFSCRLAPKYSSWSIFARAFQATRCVSRRRS